VSERGVVWVVLAALLVAFWWVFVWIAIQLGGRKEV